MLLFFVVCVRAVLTRFIDISQMSVASAHDVQNQFVRLANEFRVGSKFLAGALFLEFLEFFFKTFVRPEYVTSAGFDYAHYGCDALSYLNAQLS